jgi:hypothetical protein
MRPLIRHRASGSALDVNRMWPLIRHRGLPCRKTGTFPPRLDDKAAGYGGFTGITRRGGRVWQETGQTRRKNAAAYPAPGVGVCPRHKSDAAACPASGSALDVNRMRPASLKKN